MSPEQPARDVKALDQSYERINEAAVRLFARNGYVATGIRDIAREAGISSATLYHHFANKEELLVAIMREGFERQIGNAQAALAGQRTPEAKLVALVRQHVLAETVRQTISNVVTVEYRFLSPDARAQVLPLRDAYDAIWDAVIREGADAGAFDVRDAHLARLAVLEMCGGPGQWYRTDGALTPEEIAETFADMALALVRARRQSGARALARIAVD